MTIEEQNEFVRAHWPDIRYAAGVVVRKAGLERDDAVQEVAILVARRLAEFDPTRSSFRTWCVWLARHVASAARAGSQRQKRDYRRTRPIDGPTGRRLAVTADQRQPDPAGEAADRDEREHWLAVLNAIHPTRRAALVRRFGLDGLGGCDLEEINPLVSRARNGQVVKQGLDRLREIMGVRA